MIETISISIDDSNVQTEVSASSMSVMKAIGILFEIAEKGTGIPQKELAEAIILANKDFPQLHKKEEQ